MKKTLATLLFGAIAASAMAQSTPVGLWRNVDDKTGEAKGEIRIVEANGALLGRLKRSLKKDTKPDATCDECPDDRKGKPIAGLEIIRGGKKAEGKEVWEGGKILDPENGKEYRASFTPIDGGQKLEVRGYIGPFWRTQTWNRAN
ncbi:MULTISPECIES: DUF2147 domain-containing protein [unclassified Variovorax]|uniref:DUF2147 domain-containing protein n=1 Tax=unclassified Variovorax TaxID=663243 RepID=UPI002579089B|nr:MULTISPECIES: DUF2147 domain-containing protein [unclassified Variovorax]MDM0090065.1 DUF2147 domain-containing protein [Variovorax sp. J22G40]MDM0148269.1 DUF2147 domain-containing protein [Variovorax sp. J2P1-31]